MAQELDYLRVMFEEWERTTAQSYCAERFPAGHPRQGEYLYPHIQARWERWVSLHQAPLPVQDGKFYWHLAIGVETCWVEDGFNFDKDRCDQVAEDLVGWAHPSEVTVRVLRAPAANLVRETQGYPTEAK